MTAVVSSPLPLFVDWSCKLANPNGHLQHHQRPSPQPSFHLSLSPAKTSPFQPTCLILQQPPARRSFNSFTNSKRQPAAVCAATFFFISLESTAIVVFLSRSTTILLFFSISILSHSRWKYRIIVTNTVAPLAFLFFDTRSIDPPSSTPSLHLTFWSSAWLQSPPLISYNRSAITIRSTATNAATDATVSCGLPSLP